MVVGGAFVVEVEVVVVVVVVVDVVVVVVVAVLSHKCRLTTVYVWELLQFATDK